LATLTLYGRLTSYPFINYGDPSYITENPNIRSGLAQVAWWAVKATYASTWHPLTWLSHAFDSRVYGLSAGGHHFTSLILHELNVLLLFLLMWRATRAIVASGMIAGLFSLHPLNVKAVAWVSQRKDLLSTFFVLLALGAYGWYVQKPSWKRFSAVALLFVMAMASNPVVAVLPFLLFLLDCWPLGRIKSWTAANSDLTVSQLPWYRSMLEKAPLLLLSIGGVVIAVVALRGGHAIGLGPLPVSWRLENAVYSYVMYLGKIFWPVRLALEYPHPLGSLTVAKVGISLLVLAGISVFVWKQRHDRPYALTGWLWYLVSLLPVIGIVQVGTQGMADRYVYSAAIGIFLILVFGTRDFIRTRFFNRKPVYIQIAAVASVVLLAALSAVSFRQIEYWQSSFDLWQHALNATKNNVVAYDSMAELLLANGSRDALTYFKAAAGIATWDPESHGAVAASLHDQGQMQQAIDEYEIAMRAHPDAKLRARIYADLGVIYRQLGNYDKARENSRLALAADPEEVEDFIRKLSLSLARQPTAFGYWLLGLRLEGADQISQARAAYDQALKLNSQFSPAMRSLALLYMRPERANAFRQP
jgi:tetratricopeptide (TPR) repeat protein